VEHASRGARKPTLKISRDAMAAMTRYGWPGNVRELRHAVERGVVLSTTEEVDLFDLPPRMREAGEVAERVRRATDGKLTLDELERAYILEVLTSVSGNKSRAADILGIDRKTLYRKLGEYGDPTS
jgi:two-component system response regulator HydG